MTQDPHGLDRLLALAGVVARGDVPAPELAGSFGDAVDTFGSGEHWRVAAPNVSGVHGMVFLVRHGDPAVSPVVDLVMAHYARGAGPTLRAVEARFGPSEHIPPLDWEPHRAYIKGPVGPGARVAVYVTTDAEPDHDLDARVTEISLRRDRA